MQVYRIDGNGFYIEPVILGLDEPLPTDCIDVQPPNGLYKARWVNGSWVEDMSISEIEELNNQPIELTDEELQMKAVRIAVQKLVRIDELSTDELNSIMMLYDEFVDDGQLYKTGDVFRHEEVLYKVVQAHTSQKDWLPSDTPSLYTKVTDDGLIEVWGDRDLTVNPFMIGDKVIFEDVVYVSLIDNNVWSPIEYAAGWIKEE